MLDNDLDPLMDNWVLEDGATNMHRVYSRTARVKAILDELKAKTPCKDCRGRFPPESMDFDHVRGEKRFNLSQPRKCSGMDIAVEVAKCDIVCSNCHRSRTKSQWRRAKLRELDPDVMATKICRELKRRNRKRKALLVQPAA